MEHFPVYLLRSLCYSPEIHAGALQRGADALRLQVLDGNRIERCEKHQRQEVVRYVTVVRTLPNRRALLPVSSGHDLGSSRDDAHVTFCAERRAR
eukprot:scaffold7835_cov382-Pinguiococcus_pyrenoidosus.AAC.3